MFFSVKDRNLFHRVDTIGNIFMSGIATSENITHGVHEMKKISIFHQKPPKYSVYFMLLTLSGRSFYQNPVQFFSVNPHGVPLPHSKVLQYYLKHDKCKVKNVIFPSDCAIHLGNKTMKIGILTGGDSVRSKNIFTIFLDILLEGMK